MGFEIPAPGLRNCAQPGEARVTIQACGVCHTDLHCRQGGINDELSGQGQEADG